MICRRWLFAVAFALLLVPTGNLWGGSGVSASTGSGSPRTLSEVSNSENISADCKDGSLPGLRKSEMKLIKRPSTGSQIDWDATKHQIAQNKKEANLLSFRDAIPLLAVLALIFAAAWVVKRFMPSQKLLAASGALHVITRTQLTAKQTLVLVKMGRQLLLLGVSSDRISTLSVVNDPEQVAAIVGQVASRHPNSMTRSFAESLAGEAEAYRYESGIEDPTVNAGGQVRNLLEKVRRLSESRGTT